MIAVEALAAARPPVAVRGVSFALDAGVHALLGATMDGVDLVLAVLAGRLLPRAGRVRVLDGAPTDAAVRRATAYVPLEPDLPDALRVDEVLATAAKLRGDEAAHAAPDARLARFGLAGLAARSVRTLSAAEARAVAIAEALTSPVVRLVLVEEPRVRVEPALAAALPNELRAAARRGAAIVFTTASPSDAGALAETQLLFDRGVLVRASRSLDPIAAMPPTGARMRVVASSGRALLAELAAEKTVTKVETEGRVVVAYGDLLPELAAAVGRAIVRAKVDVLEMRPDHLTLEELRAANAGVEEAFRAAYARATTATAAAAAKPTAPAPAAPPPPRSPEGGSP